MFCYYLFDYVCVFSRIMGVFGSHGNDLIDDIYCLYYNNIILKI